MFLTESYPTGHQFAYISADDADFGTNGEIDTELVTTVPPDAVVTITDPLLLQEELADMFVLDNNFLSLKNTLDRERIDRYDVTIKACDHGYRPR